MAGTLISLGANLGNVRESMAAAKRLLDDAFGPRNLRFSHLYRTPPVGGPAGQGDFLNAVASIETNRSVWEVWEIIKQVETNLGRQRQFRWEARRIDIDLLLYGQQRIWTPHLKVPHPRMCMRTFVLKPADEMVPDWIDPVTGWTIHELNTHLERSKSDDSMIRVLSEDSIRSKRLQEAFERATGNDRIQVRWDVGVPSQLAKSSGRTKHSAETVLAEKVLAESVLAESVLAESVLAESVLAESVLADKVLADKVLAETELGVKLTIAAVSCPDPMAVQWEDFSAPWARWLDLEVRNEDFAETNRRLVGPRYLMPADDIEWAVHEIMAADQAMQCWLERSEPFLL
ncbi:MAG: 2-amino-4-hydroxy-6-hydroxymethyldihydropteridine diphosphokinase [Pirellula sp.]